MWAIRLAFVFCAALRAAAFVTSVPGRGRPACFRPLRACAGDDLPGRGYGCPQDGTDGGLSLQERVALKLREEAGLEATSGDDAPVSCASCIDSGASGWDGRTRNLRIAVTSFLSSAALFFFQHSAIAPANANPVILLRAMETQSAPLATALTNGRPTVIDFYADWCENCKAMAPTMKALESEYAGKVNFVVVDGNSEDNYDLVDAFHVDAIPHLAMVTKKGDVETALVGLVPKKVMEADINALLAGRDLPYVGFDAFEGTDHNIRGQVDML